MSISNATIVGTHGDSKVTACFVEQQRHPNRDEAGGHPRVEVVVVAHLHIDDTARMQLPKSFAGEIGCAAESKIAASVAIDRRCSTIEPGLRHRDGGEGVRDKAGWYAVLTADPVIPGPLRCHLSIRNRADHRIPGVRGSPGCGGTAPACYPMTDVAVAPGHCSSWQDAFCATGSSRVGGRSWWFATRSADRRPKRLRQAAWSRRVRRKYLSSARAVPRFSNTRAEQRAMQHMSRPVPTLPKQ